MKRSVLAAALIVLCAALLTGQGKTLKLFFYSPELTDQYNDMAKAYQAETGNTLDITVNQADYVTLLRAKLKGMEISCGCFGNNEKLGTWTLIRDSSLLFLALAVTIGAFLIHRRGSTRPA